MGNTALQYYKIHNIQYTRCTTSKTSLVSFDVYLQSGVGVDVLHEPENKVVNTFTPQSMNTQWDPANTERFATHTTPARGNQKFTVTMWPWKARQWGWKSTHSGVSWITSTMYICSKRSSLKCFWRPSLLQNQRIRHLEIWGLGKRQSTHNWMTIRGISRPWPYPQFNSC